LESSTFYDAAGIGLLIVDVDPAIDAVAAHEFHGMAGAKELAFIGTIRVEFLIRVEFSQDILILGKLEDSAEDSVFGIWVKHRAGKVAEVVQQAGDRAFAYC